MAAKAERLEARLTSTERKQIEQAAALAGESVSSFVVLAALGRADILVRDGVYSGPGGLLRSACRIAR